MDYNIILSDGDRLYLIENHDFLFNQFIDRIFPNFDKKYIEGEMDKFNERLWDKAQKIALHHDTDPEIYSEHIDDQCADYGLGLSEMRAQLILSGAALLFHNWEKTLRDFLEKNLLLPSNAEIIQDIFDKKFHEILKAFKKSGWNIREEKFFDDLDTLRLVVNVYKHGKGGAFEELKELKPEYFFDDEEVSPILIDYINLNINENEFIKLSDSIKQFWIEFPKLLLLDIKQLK